MFSKHHSILYLLTALLVVVFCQWDFVWAQQSLGPAIGSVIEAAPMRVSELPQVRESGSVPMEIPSLYPADPSVVDAMKQKAHEPSGRAASPERDKARGKENGGDNPEGLTANFQGIAWTNIIPPDPVMAAGPNHVVVVVNSSLAIYTKSGTLVSQTTLSTWFANVNPPGSIFDPKVVYDHHANRWVVLALSRRITTSVELSSYLISASQTSDPTGSWNNYNSNARLDGTQNSPYWADYPGLGFDHEALYITSNQFDFDNGFHYAKLRIFNKSQLYAGQTLTYADFWNMVDADNELVFTLKPAHHFGAPTSRYLLNTRWYGLDFVTLWRIDNPIGTSPTLTRQATVTVGSYSFPPDAVQQGSSNLIDTGDSRTQDAMYRDHDFLMRGDVFTEDVIETWVSFKMDKEVKPMALRPHPYEFGLYFDV